MKVKTVYRCSSCGYENPAWSGKCPQCQSWGTMEESVVEKKSTRGAAPAKSAVKAQKLKLVTVDRNQRLMSSSQEFDRVLGGGLVRDSVTILTARPGAGKSTLLLELSKDYADKGLSVLYVSGEESDSQIKARALRIMKEIPDNIWILATGSMDLALQSIAEIDPQVVFLDSIQTFELSAYTQRAGSPTQTVECANAIVDVAKSPAAPRAVIMIGHVTKNDELAGLRTLEHLVDTVLFLEGESDEPLRVLMSTKNRFGPTGEIGLFSMGEDGIKAIDNPSEHFVTQRRTPVPGAALSVIKEGSRLITVEVESLVSQSYTPYPIRIGDSLRKDQLNTLISILEERGGVKLYDKNVILKTTGGLRLTEQAVNLAIIISIVSSVKNIGLDNKTVFIAEVGLTGELKRVPMLDQRLREVDRLGYQKAYIPPTKTIKADLKNLEVIQCETLNDVLTALQR